MANRKAKLFDVVSYRNANGETTDVVVIATQLGAPPAPTLTASPTGGELEEGAKSYLISAVINGVETLASAAATVTTSGSTSTVEVDWTDIYEHRKFRGASAFNVYGRTSGSEELLATVAPGSATSYLDEGTDTPDGEPPEESDEVSFKNFGTKTVQTGVPIATTMESTNAYFNV